jgi:hypothetical protein
MLHRARYHCRRESLFVFSAGGSSKQPVCPSLSELHGCIHHQRLRQQQTDDKSVTNCDASQTHASQSLGPCKKHELSAPDVPMTVLTRTCATVLLLFLSGYEIKTCLAATAVAASVPPPAPRCMLCAFGVQLQVQAHLHTEPLPYTLAPCHTRLLPMIANPICSAAHGSGSKLAANDCCPHTSN